MSEKGTFDKLIDSGKELLKDGEEFIEEKTGSSIDIFSDSEKEKKAKNNLKKGKEAQEIKTKKELIDVKSSIILSKIKKQLKDGFNDFKTKIKNVSSMLLSDDEKEKHIKTAQKEYDEIMKMLTSYKNDGDFKKGYESVNTKVTEWIETLEKQDSNNIVDSVKHNLEILKADMLELNGKTKEEIQKTKAAIQEKYQDLEENNKRESILKKYGVPAGIAGIIVSFLGFLRIGKKEKTMFTKAFTFIKNSFEGIKGFFGFGKNEKETTEKTTTIEKGNIKESGNYSTYTNSNLEIKLEKKQIKSIKIDGIKYKFNQENLGKISFIQNNKDILKIGNKEIDLFTLIENIKEKRDTYIIYKNFKDSNDLKIEKV